MSEPPRDCSNSADEPQPEQQSRRRVVADRLPFILRAWWLRDYQEYRDVAWAKDFAVTGPVWSAYSDPLCDAGNLDFP